MNTEPKNLAAWTQLLHEEEMPIFSNTTRKIQTTLADDNKGAADLASVIMQDPNLTARLLKMSKSIYYNPSNRKMVTITSAIVVLGSEVIRELSLVCALFESILSKKNRDRANKEIALAIHAAVQAKALAFLARDTLPEEVFIASLLKNIGSIAFWCFSQQQGAAIIKLVETGVPQHKAEQQVLGFSLVKLSKSLCQSWQLSGLTKDSIHNIESRRTRLVYLSHSIPLAIQEGWNSTQMKECLAELAKITNKSPAVLKDVLKDNTKAAVKIAKHFGAHEASHFIQLDTAEETPALAETPSPTITEESPYRLQFQILQDISQLLCGKINIDLLFEMVMEGIHRGVGMDRSCFLLATPNKKNLNEKFSFGWDKKDSTQKVNFILAQDPENIFTHACQSDAGLWATPEHHYDYYSSHVLNRIGKIECFLFPLFIGDNFLGLFYADRAFTHKKLTQDDFNIAKHFTQQAVLGLNLYRTKK